jgi:phosphoglycolate phosphatase
MLPVARPRALIFDWDNTLVDSWECIRQSYNLTFRHFGMPEWDMEETQARVAASMRDSFPAMFGERWGEARDVFTQGFAAIHMEYLKPLPGAPELLQGLKEAGLLLAVVSNKRGHFLRKEAQAIGWADWFTALVGADDAKADKPAPDPVHLALAGTGIAPGADVWFVGDSPIDMECAANSGCTPILLRPDSPPYESAFAHPPARILAGCGPLADLVRETQVHNHSN